MTFDCGTCTYPGLLTLGSAKAETHLDTPGGGKGTSAQKLAVNLSMGRGALINSIL